MNSDLQSSSGRVGWLLAALLFGLLAGGGIAWMLINRHVENSPVVIYQMPTPAPSVAPFDAPNGYPSTVRRRHHTVHPAEDLPGMLEGTQADPAVSPTPAAELAAGFDGATASGSMSPTTGAEPSTTTRETVLVDGIAITQPALPSSPSPRPANRVLYDVNSTQVDDSLTFAIEALEKYVARQGFALREDTWGGELYIGKAKAISHQLFKGNDYWFGMGCAAAGSSIRIRLYDNEGNPADTNYWQREANDGSFAAAEIQCQHTGTYFIVIAVEKAASERVPWGVIYAFR